MNTLSKIYIFKISITVIFWCVPLLLFSNELLVTLGLYQQGTSLFLRLLGWAYLALCIGYFNGLLASLKNNVNAGPIYMGLVSNGGACILLKLLCFYG